MEEIKEIIKKVKNTEHSFYCDECDKYLGTTREYEDGWYPKLGEFELELYVDGWYHMKKCLCDDCKKSIMTNIKIGLLNIGFEKIKGD